MKSEDNTGIDKNLILKGYTLKELKEYFSSMDEKYSFNSFKV